MEIEQAELKKFKLVGVAYLTKELAKYFHEPAMVDLSLHARFASEEVALRVIQKVWGREVERQEHEYPADWWQAFKARWFPKWMCNLWPVKMTRVVIMARELYPSVAFPEKNPVVTVDKIGPYLV